MFLKFAHRLKIFPLIVLWLFCVAPFLSAQDDFTRMMETIASSRVKCNFTYALSGSGPVIEGKGSLVLQGEMFRMESNGLSVWCNGSEKWTADFAAEEVIVETVSSDVSDMSFNPALLLISAGRNFTHSSSGTPAVFQGKEVEKWVLVPRDNGSDVSSLVLYTDTRCTAIKGAVLLSENSAKMEIVLESFELSPASGTDEFECSEKSFAPTWIITDLR